MLTISRSPSRPGATGGTGTTRPLTSGRSCTRRCNGSRQRTQPWPESSATSTGPTPTGSPPTHSPRCSTRSTTCNSTQRTYAATCSAQRTSTYCGSSPKPPARRPASSSPHATSFTRRSRGGHQLLGLVTHSHAGSQGGFNRLSQHLEFGGVQGWRRLTGARRPAMRRRDFVGSNSGRALIFAALGDEPENSLPESSGSGWWNSPSPMPSAGP